MAKFLSNALKAVTPSPVTEVPSNGGGSVVTVTVNKEAVQDDKVPEKSFWCVEEPFVVNQAIPSDLSKASTGKTLSEINPVKSAFNLFGSFEEAAAYGQRLNRNLVIFEIKPSATVRPQLALVAKIEE